MEEPGRFSILYQLVNLVVFEKININVWSECCIKSVFSVFGCVCVGPGLAGEAGESLEIEVANVNLYC